MDPTLVSKDANENVDRVETRMSSSRSPTQTYHGYSNLQWYGEVSRERYSNAMHCYDPDLAIADSGSLEQVHKEGCPYNGQENCDETCA